MSRGEPSEDVGGFDGFGQLLFRHGLDLAAENDFFRTDADFVANFARDQVVVAGENLDGDTVLAKNLDGFGGGVLGWVEESQVTG